jgi:hypothetical protein
MGRNERGGCSGEIFFRDKNFFVDDEADSPLLGLERKAELPGGGSGGNATNNDPRKCKKVLVVAVTF